MRIVLYRIVLIATLFLCACSDQKEPDKLIIEIPSDPNIIINQSVSPSSIHIQSEKSVDTPALTDVQIHEPESSVTSPNPISTKSGEQSKPSFYEFHDIAIKECIEQYFDKDASELTAEDYAALAQLYAFSFDTFNKNIVTLSDLPALFPKLRYVSLGSSWFDEAFLSAEECVVLEEMQSLCAVDIYADGLPSLAFTERLPYVSLRYTEQAYLSDKNNLADLSVLGRDFIENRMTGHIMEYVRVADGSRMYELVVTDYEVTEDIWDEWNETKVFLYLKEETTSFFS